MAGSSTVEAAFYFDLGSPLAYLAAESILHVLPGPVEWQPVLAQGLASRAQARESFDALGIEQRAHELGLQPLRWPADFPFDSEPAMRVATYAKSIGRTVPFAQAAFRQAFAGGNSLAQSDNVLIAAAACEMHPAAVLKGAELLSVRQQLAAATADAAAAGVSDVPAVRVGERVFVGASALEQAEAAMR